MFVFFFLCKFLYSFLQVFSVCSKQIYFQFLLRIKSFDEREEDEDDECKEVEYNNKGKNVFNGKSVYFYG